MAMVFGSWGSVRYTIGDGSITWFELNDVMLYDRRDGTETDGWRDRLIETVKRLGLDREESRHAFVNRLADEGAFDDR